VAIEYIEKSIIEKAFADGYATPRIPSVRSDKKIAVVGSGPSGLAAAAQLNYAGHHVTVFERADEIGGLLRYGIPDFKLDKQILDRRINLMIEEGVKFQTNVNVGETLSVDQLKEEFDAVLALWRINHSTRLTHSRKKLKGVYFAMDFLHNKTCAWPERKFRLKKFGLLEKTLW
jgi:glutamate synthase (NADPH/NADH) small chain